jgi:tetratricopeptide (TPR) repeat protein
VAKKKRRQGPGRPGRPPRSTPLPVDLPDPRALERSLHDLVGGSGNAALDRAQELMYQAFAGPEGRRQIELARKALTLCPDCADAYVLLAENAAGRREALALYEQGVAAGERALGEQGFRQAVGHFWGILPTRPYMRARLGLACSLWEAGRREEAVGHAQEILRLNPNDNQGARYTLAAWLLSLDRDDDLARLLDQYQDGMAAWAYTRALLAFRRHGDTPETRRLLQVARRRNAHVPAYLLGQKFPPMGPPRAYSPGDENEALNYIGSFLAGWRSTLGAVAWVRQVEKSRRPQKEEPQPRGPLGLVKNWLQKRLPQEDDVWQAVSRPLTDWIILAGEKARPWLTLVLSLGNDLLLASDVSVERPSAKHVWDVLVRAMQGPKAGAPHRPTELQVQADERWETLRPHLEEVGVRLVVADELGPMDAVFPDLVERIAGKPRPGLLDVAGVKPEQVARFYEAAAHYFSQAPWRRVGYEAAIQVECARFQSGPWYAVIIGQSGLTLGLAMYEELGMIRRMWSRPTDDDENARQTVGMSVIFGEHTDIPVADLEAGQRYGWKVARPDAYPLVFHKDRGRTMRPPLAWELELLEVCLRAIPGFVDRHPQGDPAREEVQVPAGPEVLNVRLSWVTEVEG